MASKSKLNIRTATLKDAAVISEFNILLAWESEEYELGRDLIQRGVRRALTSESLCRYYVAENNDEIVGQLMITYEVSDWRDGIIWWIQSVYVAKNARRSGVLKSMFEHVKKEALMAKDVRCIRLYVDNQNHTALKCYTDIGLDLTDYLVMESAL